MRARTTSSSSRRQGRRHSPSARVAGAAERLAERNCPARGALRKQSLNCCGAFCATLVFSCQINHIAKCDAISRQGLSEGKRHGKTGNQAEGGCASGAVQVVQARRQQREPRPAQVLLSRHAADPPLRGARRPALRHGPDRRLLPSLHRPGSRRGRHAVDDRRQGRDHHLLSRPRPHAGLPAWIPRA